MRFYSEYKRYITRDKCFSGNGVRAVGDKNKRFSEVYTTGS